MDDETAEIELLQQNLNKTSQISRQMTTILDSFDGRLAKLQKSILPLYTTTQILNRRRSNIGKTLANLKEMSFNEEDLVADEAIILRGPQLGQLNAYMDALERLNTSIAFNTTGMDTAVTSRLVETGAKRLAQLYTQVVAEGSSGATPAPGSESMLSSFPSSLLPTLSPVVQFLRTLPTTMTHPSHPASADILATLKEAQLGYADMRGNWSVKCVEGQGKRLVVRAESVDPLTTGAEFRDWVELILGIAEEEHKLLLELSPLSSSQMIASAFTVLLAPILKNFSQILGQLVALTKKSLPQYSFLTLSAYEGLLSLQPHWDDLLSRSYVQEKNELKDGLQTLRALCLRSFPEFLADIKLASASRDIKGMENSSRLAEFTISTVEYVRRIPQVQSEVESALYALGDGNWKMGEGVQVGRGGKDNGNLIEHFLHDVVTTTIASVNAISRNKRPPFRSVFLLNNISYLRQNLLLQLSDDAIQSLISPATTDALNSAFRTAKAAYFDSNFSPLMQVFTEYPKDESSKAVAKEKFSRFFNLLDEVVERHRLARVLEDDPRARKEIEDETVMLVVPAFRLFTQKQRDKEFSKNPQKYIKRSAEDVEAQLRSLF